jgi:hypothetical protein
VAKAVDFRSLRIGIDLARHLVDIIQKLSSAGDLETAIAAEIVKAKQSHEPFTLRDLRRTLETLLAQRGMAVHTFL